MWRLRREGYMRVPGGLSGLHDIYDALMRGLGIRIDHDKRILPIPRSTPQGLADRADIHG